jgi:RHS repeat-associated protein
VITEATDNDVRWRWHDAAFGDSEPDENPEALGAFEYNLRFPGQYFDEETGLHYNYFRDYDSVIGRYVESDPIGLEGGPNVYEYASASPLRNVDPLGLNPVAGCAVGAFGGPVGCGVGAVVGTALAGGAALAALMSIPGDTSSSGDVASTATGTCKDPNGEECEALARKIENIRQSILAREIALQLNPNQLPERLPPGAPLRADRRGHRVLINQDWQNLKKLEDQYDRECRGMRF